MELNFNTRGNERQKDAARAWNNNDIFEVYYGGAKGGAKSFLGANLIFADALTYPETHYFIARKKLDDLIKHTLPTIYEVFDIWKLTKEYYNYQSQRNYFELYNKSKVFMLHAKDEPGDPLFERFGSMQMTRGWIEEGGEFSESAYQNLKISIGRWKNNTHKLAPKLLTTCNPKKNYIYRNVYKPNKEKKLSKDTVFIPALIRDNKCLPETYIKNLESTLKGAARQRLLLGNWEYDSDDNSLIDNYDAIIDTFSNTFVESGNKYIICDAARFGSDKAIIIVFDGLRAIEKFVFDISKTTEIADKIKDLQLKYNVPNRQSLVDSDGVGGGVVDQVGCIGFVNNATPLKTKDNKNYDNLKSQCAFKLAEIINDSKLFIDFVPTVKEKEDIIEEFEQLKYQESDGKNKLIPKDEMKANIGRSSDWLDTFIMRMFFELRPARTFKTKKR